MEERAAKKSTIYDIADRAGTSATTVSRVLSGVQYPIKPELRQRVLDAAQALNYSPNKLARSLKKNNSRDIGVVIPTISNPFYTGVTLSIEKYVSKYEYSLLLCNTFRDEKKERQYMQSLYEKQVQGIILSTVCRNELEEYQRYIDNGLVLVLLDQKVEGLACSNVQVDAFKGTVMAMDYLIGCGHRKIAFVSSPLTRWTRRETFEGYRYALAKHNIPLNEEYILLSDTEEGDTVQDGYEFLVGKLLAGRFIREKISATAVMAVNDMVAFGFMQQARAMGKSIPQDISVVGFDDIPFAKMFSPALTTVSYPAEEIGNLVGSIMMDRIHGRTDNNVSINLEPSLQIRESVRKI